MRELTLMECEMVVGAVNWDRVLENGNDVAMQTAISGAVGGFAFGMAGGGIGAAPGALLGGVGGAVGGFIGGAGYELWRQCRPHTTPLFR